MSRISSGTMTVAIFALLMGLAGAYTVRQYLNKPEAAPVVAPTPPRPPATIPLASLDLVAGKVISLGDMAVVPLTSDLRKKVGGDAMTNARQLVGRILKAPLKKGEPFLTTSLYAEGMGPSVVERLQPGFRAVTVHVNNIGSVAGFAGPGTVVDVLFRASARNHLPETTVTLLQKVEVLAFGEGVVPGVKHTGATPQSSQQGMVTLAVSPAQANALKVVEGQGEMSLAIRGTDDDTLLAAGTLPTLTLDQLLGIRPPPAPTSMEIYRGGSRQTLIFDKQQVVDERFGGVGAAPASSPSNTAAFPPPRSIQIPNNSRPISTTQTDR